LREPYGVVGRIVPFNHPLMFAVARTAAALASGNSVVVKPPETSPLSAMLLAEIAAASLPPGLFNIVTGLGRTVGDGSFAIPTSSGSHLSGRSRPDGQSSARRRMCASKTFRSNLGEKNR
jgi:acyl-CoA reductase-like NAD-dependent aldehyde dehydrogenase